MPCYCAYEVDNMYEEDYGCEDYDYGNVQDVTLVEGVDWNEAEESARWAGYDAAWDAFKREEIEREEAEDAQHAEHPQHVSIDVDEDTISLEDIVHEISVSPETLVSHIEIAVTSHIQSLSNPAWAAMLSRSEARRATMISRAEAWATSQNTQVNLSVS